MLNWKNVEFLKSGAPPNRRLPQIAVVGRSNVGKSSLLNFLFSRKNLVKISATPGKTRTLQWFCVDEFLHVVDLPGYGYSTHKLDQEATEQYLTKSPELRVVLHLIDSRHPLQRADLQFLDWAHSISLPLVRVYTKGDKLPLHRRPDGLVTSATTGMGRKELIETIETSLCP
ncbi:MAG: ribosome biogenesis GTP-binding protein YsxC [Verrucomicrobia bacterium]|nr:ribosome biogenesis GTP-binding protein YsxC [Verrucomicrobiota bacterium]